MKNRLILMIVLVFFGSAALAQTVPVRSGEHPGFSRLVFDFEIRPDWTLTRAPDGYVLTISDNAINYDLGDVFRLIPRTRISDLAQPAPGEPLRINLACSPCHADAFEFRTTSLVIDIRDGPPPPDSAFETGAISSSVAFGSKLATAQFAGIVLPHLWLDPKPAQRGAPAPPMARDGRFAQISTVDRYLNDTPDTSRLTHAQAQQLLNEGFALQPEASGAVTIIAKELSRAAGQGLVSIETPLPDRKAPDVSQSNTPPPVSDLGGQGLNIRVRTSIDRDNAPIDSSLLDALTAPQCPAPESYNIAAWGDEARLGHEIAKYRRAMMDEFDRPGDEALTHLARHYLYLGFGAEARALLSGYPGRSSEQDMLYALAAVIEHGPGERTTALGPLAPCGAQASLWAILAGPIPPPSGEISMVAVQSAFNTLPLHLRRLLGPDLAKRLSNMGEWETARAILAVIERAPGDHGPRVALRLAEIATPDPFVREAALRELMATNGPEAAPALLQLVEMQLEAGEVVTPDLIDALAGFAFENRGNPLGPELKQAEFSARLAEGDAVAVMSELVSAEQNGVITEAGGRTLRLKALENATQTASDARFLLLAGALQGDIESNGQTRPLRMGIATRAYDLGFSALAESYLRPEETGEETLKLARARLALMRGDGATARAALVGLPADVAAPLSAEILALDSDHRNASGAFQAMGDTDRAQVEAIRARDPSLISSLAENNSILAALAEPRTLPDRAEARPGAAIDQAARIRREIEELGLTLP